MSKRSLSPTPKALFSTVLKWEFPKGFPRVAAGSTELFSESCEYAEKAWSRKPKTISEHRTTQLQYSPLCMRLVSFSHLVRHQEELCRIEDLLDSNQLHTVSSFAFSTFAPRTKVSIG